MKIYRSFLLHFARLPNLPNMEILANLQEKQKFGNPETTKLMNVDITVGFIKEDRRSV